MLNPKDVRIAELEAQLAEVQKQAPRQDHAPERDRT
jgi:hypothetical protein